MIKVLVTYASKHHSTAEIGCAIGELLQQFRELQVDIRSVKSVQDITTYDAIILGSAVYMGQWQATASDFLKKHEQELTQRPVWLFSSGPIGEGDPKSLLKGWQFPEALQTIADRIKPYDVALFHGSLVPTELNFLERSAVKIVHAKIGDSRDWEMIMTWADSIAQALCGVGRKESSC